LTTLYTLFCTGVQRTAPSELIRKKRQSLESEAGDIGDETVDEDEDSFEIVDKFRFSIDADSLREAIVRKSALKGRQQLSSPRSDPYSSDFDDNEDDAGEITFNESLLDKLASGEAVIDDSGENTVIRLVLDHDDFADMVESRFSDYQNANAEYDDEEDKDLMYSSDATYVDRKESDERKKSLEYSAAKMKEAENFINRDMTLKRKEVKVFDKEKFLNRAVAPEGPSVGRNLNQEDSNADPEISKNKIKSVKKKKEEEKMKKRGKPRQYLADMSTGIILENVYGTAVIGFALAASIFFFDFLSISMVTFSQFVLNFIVLKIPYFNTRKAIWKKTAKPLVLFAILFSNAFLFFLQKFRDGNRFANIGYKEGQKFKNDGNCFRRRVNDMKLLFSSRSRE
jgi:hypothetical protein